MSSRKYYLFNTYEEALNISKELYNLIKPVRNQNEIVDKVFLLVPHQDPKNPQTALIVNEQFEINFSTDADKQAYIDLFKGDQSVSSTLNNLSKSTIKDLLPKTTKSFTEEELIASGHLGEVSEKHKNNDA